MLRTTTGRFAQPRTSTFDSCCSIIGEFDNNIARTEVGSSCRLAWAFTRLSNIGHPQCLEQRKRSKLLTFFLFYRDYDNS